MDRRKEIERLVSQLEHGGLSRREFVWRAFGLGLSVSSVGLLLAACGGKEGGGAEGAVSAGASAFTTRALRTRFSAVSPESGVLSDKQGILAKRRALASGERDVRDVWC